MISLRSALRPSRHFVVYSVALALLATLLPPAAAAPIVDASLAVSGDLQSPPVVEGPVRHVYDGAGRLSGTVAADGTGVDFVYDSVGNLTQRLVHEPQELGIVGFDAPVAVVGESVTVVGTGFDLTASNNDVEISGVDAEVTSVSSTELEVVVPVGATTGLVSVVTPSQNAQSTEPLLITPTSDLSVSDVSDDQVDPGDVITITGSGFDPIPANNKVRFPFADAGLLGEVTAASATEVTVEVPAIRPNPGDLTITTPSGSTTAPIVVAPPNRTVANTDYLGALTLDSATSGTPNGNRDMYFTFDATAGDRVSLTFSATGNNDWIYVYSPSGVQVVRERPGWIDALTLPETGTYWLLVDPKSSGSTTATFTVHTLPDVVGTIEIGGQQTSITVAKPGQRGVLTFDSDAGERISATVVDASVNATLTFVDPKGITLASHSSNFFEPMTLPEGTHQIIVNPSGTSTGTTRVTLVDMPPDVDAEIEADGSPHVVTIGTAGQNAYLRFDGEAGDRVSLKVSGIGGLTSSSLVRVSNPDGSTLKQNAGVFSHGWFTDVMVLPETGEYVIFVNPQSTITQNITFNLWTVPPDVDVDIEADGASNVVTITTPGQNAYLRFDGEAGDRVSLKVSGIGGLTNNSLVRLSNPDGTVLTQNTGVYNKGWFTDVEVLPQTGEYEIFVNPQSTITQNITLNLWTVPADVEVDIQADGQPNVVTIGTPGQNAYLRFDGDVGDRVSLKVSGIGGLSNNSLVRVSNPDGSTLTQNAGVFNQGWFTDVMVLPQSGEYTVFIDPQSTITQDITVNLWDMPADVDIDIDADGTSNVVTIGTPGQNAYLRFDGEPGDRVSLKVGPIGGLTDSSLVRVSNPDGTTLKQNTDVFNQGWFTDAMVLAQSGEYTVFIDPESTITQDITVNLWGFSDVEDEIEIDGDQVPVVVTSPGQNGRLTFAGTEGQSVTIAVADTSMNPTVSLRDAADTALVSGQGNLLGPVTLPATGDYTILVDPSGMTVGEARITLTDAGEARGTGIRLASSDPTMTHLSGQREVRSVFNTVQFTGLTPGAGRADEGNQSREEPRDEAPVPTVENPPSLRTWNPPEEGERWETGWERSPWLDVPVLEGDPAKRAISGQVLDISGVPLSGVSVSVGATSTKTDDAGRFVVEDLAAGRHVILVDGTTTNSTSSYPSHEIGVEVTGLGTTVLDAPVYLSPTERAHKFGLGRGNRRGPTVLTHPDLPGLEIRIPAGAQVTDYWGDPVTELSLVPVPNDRPPFPLPEGVNFPMYFAVQPAGVYVEPGAQVVYPNSLDLEPGTTVALFNYDPELRDWYVYGNGVVSKDGSQIVPEPDVTTHYLTMFSYSPGFLSWPSDLASGIPGGAEDGDPVDLGTGLFTYDKADIILPDVIDIGIFRSYNSGSGQARGFGIGMSHAYDMFLRSDNPFQDVDLVLPDGKEIHYERISPGTGAADAVFEHVGTPGPWHMSLIRWNGNGWDLELTDGTVYVMGNKAPLQAIRDRNGNTVWLYRQGDYYGSQTGRVTKVVSPNGRWLSFTYDGSNRVTSVTDNIGRQVGYQYDGSGRLWKVTDAEGGVTTYGYDTNHRMTSISDARGITFLENIYDGNGRVETQATAGEGSADFSYTVGGSGQVEVTEYTDAEARTRHVEFDTAGYPIVDRFADGTVDEVTYQFERDPATHMVEAIVDPLGRRTEYTRDDLGGVLTEIRLAGTADEQSTAFTYETRFHLPASVTDPLGHTTEYGYDQRGNLATLEDATDRVFTYDHDTDGLVIDTADPLDNHTSFSYDHGDQVSTTDPEGRTVGVFVDAAGRPAIRYNGWGAATVTTFDDRHLAVGVEDPYGATTTLDYDENGNLVEVTDARSHTTTYSYDQADRVAERVDPNENSDLYEYDSVGNLTSHTDRRGYETLFEYDNLDRLTDVDYAATGGTLAYVYDDASRLTTLTDSIYGSTTYTYDPFDRATSQTSPDGAISYDYDDAGRLIEMTVTGHDPTSYTYDDAGRLLEVAHDGSTVEYTLDAAGRVATVSGLNDVATTYGRNDAGELTSITVEQDTTPLGDLSYIRDSSGRIAEVGGSWARTVIPNQVESAVYGPGDQILTWDQTGFSWDDAGNLTSDGTNTYTWSPRGTLAAVSDGTTTWTNSYDGSGRRTSLGDDVNIAESLHSGVSTVAVDDGTTQSLVIGGPAPDLRHGLVTGSSTVAYAQDGFGSVQALIGPTGIQAEYAYGPFGAGVVEGTVGANTIDWIGRDADPTGLIQIRARYYHPDLQRFISQDPLGLVAGPTNPYLYAGNDPVNQADSSGLFVDTAVDVGFIAHDLYQLFTGGRKHFGANMGALALDLVGLMIPVVTGLGAASKAARFGDDLVDGGLGLGRYGDNAGNIGRACSFDGDTGVLMANGTTKPISEIKEGDYVYATDPETGETGPREVIATLPHTDQLLTLYTSGGEIVTTEDHRYWNATDGEWQESQDLDVGDHLLTANGGEVLVEGLDWTTLRTDTAYELTIKDLHTFYVGDDAVLVHNTCPTGSQLWGKSFDEVDDLIPEGWVKAPTRSPGGVRYSNPARPGEQVRIMPGNPNDPNPLKRGPYARISTGGQVSEPIPLYGNPNL